MTSKIVIFSAGICLHISGFLPKHGMMCIFLFFQIKAIWGHRSNSVNPKTLPNCDRLCLNRPFMSKQRNSVFFLYHPLTEFLLITTLFFFCPYEVLFSSYTTVSVVQLKMLISRNTRFQFCIGSPFTYSRNN